MILVPSLHDVWERTSEHPFSGFPPVYGKIGGGPEELIRREGVNPMTGLAQRYHYPMAVPISQIMGVLWRASSFRIDIEASLSLSYGSAAISLNKDRLMAQAAAGEDSWVFHSGSAPRNVLSHGTAGLLLGHDPWIATKQDDIAKRCLGLYQFPPWPGESTLRSVGPHYSVEASFSGYSGERDATLTLFGINIQFDSAPLARDESGVWYPCLWNGGTEAWEFRMTAPITDEDPNFVSFAGFASFHPHLEEKTPWATPDNQSSARYTLLWDDKVIGSCPLYCYQSGSWAAGTFSLEISLSAYS